MRRTSSFLVVLIVIAGCEKPVPFEHVDPAPRTSGVSVYVDGSVVHDDLDAGLETDTGETDAESDDEEDVPFTKHALLEAEAACALAHYVEFRDKARALRDASATWAEDRSDENWASARAAFRVAMASWQRAEPFNFGPAAPSSQKGGRDLGDKIYYPYPSIDRCRIDQQLVGKRYGAEVVRAGGLATFEYLAYYAGRESSCSAQININADGSWAALSVDELAQRRADFAAAIAQNVADLADELVTAWQPDGGNFLAQVTDTGAGKTYASEQDALNNLNNAIFYIEKDVKDLKLGRPLGKSGCTTTTCPEALESPLSGLSASNIRENLVGMRQVFEGCKPGYRGVAFDDWLRAANPDGDLADRMLKELAEAQAAADKVGSLEDALASNPQPMVDLYTDVKNFTDILKTEFIAVTALEPPAGLEGDND